MAQQMGHNNQWTLVGGGKDQFLQPLQCSEGTPVWYPLIPLGTFEYTDPASGETYQFSVTQEYLDEMVANLRGGNYGGHGIPIDEDNFHRTKDKAEAWIEDLEVRDGGLWGLVRPTSEGLAEIEGRPYISPKFTIGDAADPKYGLRNFIRSGALVSQPWFWPQPGLQVAPTVTVMASMSTLDDAAASAVDDHGDQTGTVDGAAPAERNAEGGTEMTPEQIEELQQQLADAQTALAEAQTALTEGQETWATEKAALETQVTERDEQITSLTERAEAAEQQQASLAERITAIEALLADKTTEAAIAAKVNELEQVRVTETIVAEDGTVLTEERALAPEFITVEASAAVLGTPEAIEVRNVFMATHNYRPPTVSLGNKPGLQPITVAASGAAPADQFALLQEAIDGNKLTESTGKKIRGIMEADGLTFAAAQTEYFRRQG